MKKHLYIFLLALLPVFAFAQADHTFELFGYSSFKLGNNTISFNGTKLLVNGTEVSGSANIINALKDSTGVAPSGAAVIEALVNQNVKLRNFSDSLARKIASDTSAKAVSSLYATLNADSVFYLVKHKMDSVLLKYFVSPTSGILNAGTLANLSFKVVGSVTDTTMASTLFYKVFDDLDDIEGFNAAFQSDNGINEITLTSGGNGFNKTLVLNDGDKIRITFLVKPVSDQDGVMDVYAGTVASHQTLSRAVLSSPDANGYSTGVLNFTIPANSDNTVYVRGTPGAYTFLRSILIEKL
jgi:hypothetical protein